jgi:hypothetical protein
MENSTQNVGGRSKDGRVEIKVPKFSEGQFGL